MANEKLPNEGLLKGRGRYVHDIVVDGLKFAAFVRSSHAHARFKVPDGLTLKSNAAIAQMPGVIGIFGAVELGVKGRCLPAINPILPVTEDSASAAKFPLLADSIVTYVGQAIAVIIADTFEQAAAAAQAVWVDYEPLPLESKPILEVRYAAGTEVDASKQTASIRSVSTNHNQPRVIAMSLEPRAIVVQHTASNDRSAAALTIWLPTQSPARAKDDMIGVLGLPAGSVRVIAPDVGGAFGSKATACPEDYVVVAAALKLKVNLKWQATRSEEFLSGTHGRGSNLNGQVHFTPDGRLTHLQARLNFELGAWLPFSAAMPLRNAARILPGPYQLQSVDIVSKGEITHQAAANIYRGAGRPEAALLMERLVDEAARSCAVDPVQMRLRNFISPNQMPYKTLTGERLDSGDYAALLQKACDLFGYNNRREEQGLRQARGELVGIGIGFYIEPCGQGWESARIDWHADGQIMVASGSSSQGQGHRTTYAAIAAKALQCAASQIKVIEGDTAQCPDGIGALASRSTAIGGSAVLQAARELRSRRDAGEALPLSVSSKYLAPAEAWSYGCVMAQVCIDRETGCLTVERMIWVDDAGTIVSPQLAKGQLLGGLAQGIGQALMEQIHYDENYQLVTGSLMDYAVPRASDVPSIQLDSLSVATDSNLLSAKGVGEAGCIGPPAALMNAVCDALCRVDSRCAHDLDFPLTSERIWKALNQFN